MADVVPNYDLEIQGLEVEKAQLELNVKAQTYRIAQIQDEVRRIGLNIEATHVAISALDERIASLKAR